MQRNRGSVVGARAARTVSIQEEGMGICPSQIRADRPALKRGPFVLKDEIEISDITLGNVERNLRIRSLDSLGHHLVTAEFQHQAR